MTIICRNYLLKKNKKPRLPSHLGRLKTAHEVSEVKIMVDYIMRPKITNLKRPGKIVEVDVAGSTFRILLTPFVEGIIGSTTEHTLVTLLQEPWYSYPFILPLAHYVGDDYIWEKLYRYDKSKVEEAKKLCYLLRKISV